ncbi:MAG TPA: DUF1176 domain-containing protein [Xanthomonadales bacterium]|nr:DUF1176 domain-containing protein [Xanthomonadales bacterium]
MRIPLICLLPLLLLASQSQAQGYKAIKDWIGGCDNTRHCTAIGLAAEAAGSYASLHFERGPAPGDEVTRIRLRVDHEISRENSWILQADDAQLLQFNDMHLVDAQSGPGIDIVIEASGELEALLGAMRSADSLTVVGDGGPVGRISLAGASAIMLWIDEQQGRLGTTTALVRRGDKLPQSIPSAVALPHVLGKPFEPLGPEDAAPLGADVRASLPADACEPLDPESGMRDEAWSVDDRALVKLLCYRGAYNFGSSWFLVDGDVITPLAFPLPAESGGAAMDSTTDLVNADFAAGSGQLSSFNRGRGIGDCGSSGQWRWDGQRFQLERYSLMGDCRGVAPDLWPVLWRSAE